MLVAVTGANGFVGRNVIARLHSQGVETVGVVRSEKNIGALSTGRYLCYDINERPGQIYEELGNPTHLVHLAWERLGDYTSASHVEKQFVNHYRFLESMVSSGLEHLTVVGTCFEYGKIEGCLSEEMPTNPINSYALAKDKLRKVLESLQKDREFSFTWARLFYLYGSGQSNNAIYTQIQSAVVEGKKFFEMSPGHQMRDYLPVETAAKHLVNLALTGQNIGIVNICSENPMKIKDLVRSWIKENGWEISLVLGAKPYSPHEAMNFWGSKRKLQAVLKN